MTPHKDFEPEIHLVLINIPFKNINWDRKKAGKTGRKIAVNGPIFSPLQQPYGTWFTCSAR